MSRREGGLDPVNVPGLLAPLALFDLHLLRVCLEPILRIVLVVHLFQYWYLYLKYLP